MKDMKNNCLFLISNDEFDYRIFSSVVMIPDYGYATTYGISISGDNVYECVEDITDEFDKLKTFCELLCKEKAYPEHLKDLVEDFLVM
ncbi:MAG: hypothetical protein IJ192_13320 [Clostridia bacterium]|nr:hypothetical protein [Clostridia bacterium]